MNRRDNEGKARKKRERNRSEDKKKQEKRRFNNKKKITVKMRFPCQLYLNNSSSTKRFRCFKSSNSKIERKGDWYKNEFFWVFSYRNIVTLLYLQVRKIMQNLLNFLWQRFQSRSKDLFRYVPHGFLQNCTRILKCTCCYNLFLPKLIIIIMILNFFDYFFYSAFIIYGGQLGENKKNLYV